MQPRLHLDHLIIRLLLMLIPMSMLMRHRHLNQQLQLMYYFFFLSSFSSFEASDAVSSEDSYCCADFPFAKVLAATSPHGGITTAKSIVPPMMEKTYKMGIDGGSITCARTTSTDAAKCT